MNVLVDYSNCAPPLPRSVRSEEKAYIRFFNITDRIIELVWMNFSGEYIRYRILQKDHYVDVNTYKTHPWIALDYRTKDRLYIEKNLVYLPKTSKELIQERYPYMIIPANFETRIRAYVTLPLYSLKYACLMALRNLFVDTKNIDKLELPGQLKEELKRTIEYRNKMIGTLDVKPRD